MKNVGTCDYDDCTVSVISDLWITFIFNVAESGCAKNWIRLILLHIYSSYLHTALVSEKDVKDCQKFPSGRHFWLMSGNSYCLVYFRETLEEEHESEICFKIARRDEDVVRLRRTRMSQVKLLHFNCYGFRQLTSLPPIESTRKRLSIVTTFQNELPGKQFYRGPTHWK